MPRKLHVDDCSSKPKYMFSFSVTNYYLKLHKKHSINSGGLRQALDIVKTTDRRKCIL